MPRIRLSTLCALSLALLSPSGLATYGQGSEAVEKLCRFSEVYRAEGWKIPGVSGAAPKGGRLALQNLPGTFLTDLVPGKSDQRMVLPNCQQDFPGRLAIREAPVRVLAMSRVDFNGRVFAYTARYEPQTLVNGVPHRSMEFVQVVFYDVDGSGRFTVMKYDMQGLFLNSPDVPEWAKRP
jgi:hypothetical protein